MTLIELMAVPAVFVLSLTAFGAGPPVRQTAADAKKIADEKQMFPDGREYDFGKAKRGTLVKHTFRIVNRSDVVIRILSIKRT